MQPNLKKAIATILKCRSTYGFYASADRYKYEYWSRDLYHSLEALCGLGLLADVKKHLSNTWNKQYLNGELPRVILDNRAKWLFRKLGGKLRHHKILFTFEARHGMETRFRRWTVDSTPLTIISTYMYSQAAKEKQFLEVLKPKITIAMKHVESNMKDYLIKGGDWRDSIPELRDKFLLSNNVIMYKLYKLLGHSEKAKIIKDRINGEFWNGEYYVDFLGSQNFDSLGASLAVLEDIPPSSRYKKLSNKILSTSSKYGIKNVNEVQPLISKNAISSESCNQSYAIWPFVAGYAVMALDKMGRKKEAKAEFRKLDGLSGFYEWYDPDNGKPKGSRDQLWSAAMYYSAAKKLIKS